MISKEEIQKIAELAKLRVEDTKIESYQKDLSAILDFIGTLKTLPSLEKHEHEQAMGLLNVYRDDVQRHSQSDDKEGGKKIAASAPKIKKGLIVSPPIFK